MSEELLQRDLINNCQKIGKWDFYNIGATSLKALKEHGIIRNVNYGAEEKKKVDGLIVQKKNVIAVIEYKKPSEFKTAAQKNKAIKQELEVARKLDAHIIIATDTKETIWVNVLTGNKIKDESGKEIKTNFDLKDERLPELIEKIISIINKKNDQLVAEKYVNPTDLARKIWQIVWSITGATPESCLYSFIELFIFKYLSDLEVLQEPENFDYLLKLYNTREPEFVIDYYARNIRRKIKSDLFPKGEDGTTIINGTVFVNNDDEAIEGRSTAFEKIIKEFNEYGKLNNIHPDFKSQLFESFLKESISKKNWGQFFTPLKVVKAMVAMAKDEIKEGIKICDPAGGVGKFVLEAIKPKLNEFYSVEKKSIIRKIDIHGYDIGFDKDEQKTIILAKANMLIYFSDLLKNNRQITDQFAKLFNDSFELKKNSILGTLAVGEKENYELILSNPPYVTSGSSNIKEEIKRKGLSDYYKINAIGVEGLFMEWIIRALKPNGKAFIIVPDGIFNRQNDKNLRQFIIDECYIDGIVSLPLNTFFTTNKKTYILCLTKKANKKDVQTDPVFTYLVSEMGETRDVYRFDIDQDDLSEAVTLYSFFKGNKASFAKINTDKRCKVFPFTDFTSSIENSWIIDKWWSEEEKIELGISEKKDKLDLLGFSSLVEDVAFTIKGFQDEIKELSEKKKSELNKKTYKIKDLFDIEKGKSIYTKNYGNLNKGDNPVYSASNNAPLTYINTNDYDGQFLTWATNGFAGYMMLIDGKFSINGDRGLLKPKMLNINLLYVKNIVEPKLRELAKGRKGENGSDEFTKVYPNMIEEVEINIPIDVDGNFDLISQKDIVDKILYVEEIKSKINFYKEQITNLTIDIESSSNIKFVSIPISDKKYFDLIRGKRITKKTIDVNKGNIPVYSSSKSENSTLGNISEDFLIKSKLILFNKPSILFNLDGSVGYCFIRRDEKYSFIDVVASLVPKIETIDLEFVLYKLREEILKTGANYQSKLYFNKINNYNVSISFPLDKNGKINIEMQKQIAEKYKKIELIKQNITNELDRISKIEIDFE